MGEAALKVVATMPQLYEVRQAKTQEVRDFFEMRLDLVARGGHGRLQSSMAVNGALAWGDARAELVGAASGDAARSAK